MRGLRASTAGTSIQHLFPHSGQTQRRLRGRQDTALDTQVVVANICLRLLYIYINITHTLLCMQSIHSRVRVCTIHTLVHAAFDWWEHLAGVRCGVCCSPSPPPTAAWPVSPALTTTEVWFTPPPPPFSLTPSSSSLDSDPVSASMVADWQTD